MCKTQQLYNYIYLLQDDHLEHGSDLQSRGLQHGYDELLDQVRELYPYMEPPVLPQRGNDLSIRIIHIGKVSMLGMCRHINH